MNDIQSKDVNPSIKKSKIALFWGREYLIYFYFDLTS